MFDGEMKANLGWRRAFLTGSQAGPNSGIRAILIPSPHSTSLGMGRGGRPCVGPVAQWLELTAHNRLVPGSSPGGPTSLRSRSAAKAAAPEPWRRRAIWRLASFGSASHRTSGSTRRLSRVARRRRALVGATIARLTSLNDADLLSRMHGLELLHVIQGFGPDVAGAREADLALGA